jgi:bifunctional NMN adenylyltransferase/nudix hydrolase
MSARPFKFSIFIGRFQPFHLAHLQLVREALQQADTAIVVIGSYKKAPSPKHPFSGEEREAMMRVALTPEENARVKVIYMHDYLYNDPMWLADCSQRVSDITDDSDSIVLVGHDHDDTSYYLELFPQWQKYLVPNLDNFPHATEIRYLYFTHDIAYKNHVHPQTAVYLEEFKNTTKFKGLKSFFDAVRSYKKEWLGAPYPPIFHTVDSVVVKSGHVLCVRRGKAYGDGQIALPGGFLNERELIRVGAIRELKEETAIAVDKKVLFSSIKAEKVFDHPDRSERGRTLTTAFFLDLGSGPLPRVKGGDDAAKAFWIPFNEFYTREEEFFEDHFHLINFFIGSPMMRVA